MEKEIGFKEKLNNLKAVHCSYTLNVKLISFNQKIRVKIFSIDPIFVSWEKWKKKIKQSKQLIIYTQLKSEENQTSS